ncbi:MAG: dockerin type I repeat-containing protein [Dehalococcoidia bacterium]
MRSLIIALAVSAAALLALHDAQFTSPTAHAFLEDTDRDGVIDLAEESTGSDPNDPLSTPESTGAEFIAGYPICSDGVDNDRDGLTDGDDPYCTDSDGDIVSDPGEVFYGSDPNNRDSFPESSRLDAILNFDGLPVFFCSDGVDNDLDGLVDDDDPGCEGFESDDDQYDDFVEKNFGSDPSDPSSVPEHESVNRGSCSDGIDNDGDGLTDAGDPACRRPPHDHRADARQIAALPYLDGPNELKNATSEAGEPRPSCIFQAASTVWYRYTAAADGVLIAGSDGSDTETMLAVWEERDGRLIERGCNSFFGTTPRSRVAFDAEAGSTYFFQLEIYRFDRPVPNVAFRLRAGTPPANDDLAGAVAVGALPFSHSVDTSDATFERGEPAAFCAGGPLASVWYSFTPAEDAVALVDTEGSNFNTVVAVWTQTPFGLSPIACGYNPNVPEDTPARAAFQAQAGETYLIQAGGYPYRQHVGNLVLSIETGASPTNDAFADAMPVPSLPFSHSVDTVTATTEPGEPRPTCIYNDVATTVWYRYTPASDTIVLATATGLDYGSFIGVYEGASLSDAAQAACGAPSFPGPRLAFQARAGRTYHIQIGSLNFGPIPFAAGDPAGVPQPGGVLELTLEAFDLAGCPPPEFVVPDVVGDAPRFGPPPPPGETSAAADIVSVGGSSDGENYCLRMEFDGPVDPPGGNTDRSVYFTAQFDTDKDRGTGYQGGLCAYPSYQGTDVEAYLSSDAGILVRIYGITPEPVPPPLPAGFPASEQFGIALFDERAVTLVIPLWILGGDNSLNFAISAYGYYGGSDCAPDGGYISSPRPARIGDVTCDGRVDSRDASAILQFEARRVTAIPCQHAADVNGNGDPGVLDALLILQYDAGLLDHIPPASHDALGAAVRATMDLANVGKIFVRYVEEEARSWPDSCLGLGGPSEACLTVVTPGYRFRLDVDGQFYIWRTNQSGSEVRLEGIAVP